MTCLYHALLRIHGNKRRAKPTKCWRLLVLAIKHEFVANSAKSTWGSRSQVTHKYWVFITTLCSWNHWCPLFAIIPVEPGSCPSFIAWPSLDVFYTSSQGLALLYVEPRSCSIGCRAKICFFVHRLTLCDASHIHCVFALRRVRNEYHLLCISHGRSRSMRYNHVVAPLKVHVWLPMV